MIIRDETASDRRAVYEVVSAAFKQSPEAELVEALSGNGDMMISLVAEHEQHLIGHIALSKMEAPFPALALAPLSVETRPAAHGRRFPACPRSYRPG